MAIVGGFDLHREQITFDYLDTETGEVSGGQIRPATVEQVREWLRRFEGRDGAFAMEATTGWKFVPYELTRAGMRAHLAEPADTKALRGPKRRAKTDRADARLQRFSTQAGFPSVGSHPNTSRTPARWCGCARTSSTSAPLGNSASGPHCSTTGCPSSRHF